MGGLYFQAVEKEKRIVPKSPIECRAKGKIAVEKKGSTKKPRLD